MPPIPYALHPTFTQHWTRNSMLGGMHSEMGQPFSLNVGWMFGGMHSEMGQPFSLNVGWMFGGMHSEMVTCFVVVHTCLIYWNCNL
jgi:hypothetical protein